MNAVFVGILAYIGAQLLLGLLVSRHIETEADYLLGGRNLGTVRAVFTIFATWFGAETCIGSAGEAYASGIAGTTADPFGYALCIFLMAAVFAVPLWKLKLTTLADLFRFRFGLGSERAVVLLLVPTSLLWAAAQVRAFGQVLGATSGWELDVTISLAALVVIIYTSAGGFLADVWTDLVQGIVLVVGLVVLAAAVWSSGEASALARLPPDALSFSARGESWLGTFERWSVPVFGSLVAQELVSRVVAARTAETARRSALLASVLYLGVGLIPLSVGLIAAATMPEIADPEQVLVLYAERHLSDVMYVVFAGALVSAILSTVDSSLLVSGSLVAHNIIVPLRPDLDERGKLRVNRAAVVAFGVIAYLLARSADSVYGLVEEASAFGSAGIFVAVVLGLFTRVGGNASALASMITGAAVYVVGDHALALPHPYTTSLFAAALAYFACAGFGSRERSSASATANDPPIRGSVLEPSAH
jgi:Na+/proline symporter